MMQVAEQDEVLNACILNPLQALAKSVPKLIWKLFNAIAHIQISKPLQEFPALSGITKGLNLTKF